MRGLQDELPRTMTLREAADLCDLKLSALRSRADRGSLKVVRRDGERHVALSELERLGLLPDAELRALRIALLMARDHDPHYEPAAICWLARLGLERPTIGFDDLTHLLAAFEALPTQPTEAWAALTTICAHHGHRRFSTSEAGGGFARAAQAGCEAVEMSWRAQIVVSAAQASVGWVGSASKAASRWVRSSKPIVGRSRQSRASQRIAAGS